MRGFESRDLPILRGLYLRSRQAAFMWLDTTGYALSDFDRDTEGEAIWVAIDTNDRPIGFLSVWRPENFVHNLFVAPEYLRRGVGSGLLAYAMPEIGIPARLKCATGNVRAVAFYKAMGWRVVSQGEAPEGPYHLMEFDGVS